MKLKYIFFIAISWMVFLFIIDGSYAIDSEKVNEIENNDLDILLEYKMDNNILNNDIYNYIDFIDDSLIPVATYNMSDVLSDNYDFLTVFAINFILNNYDYYEDRIVILEDYKYDSGYGEYTTNKYVSVDLIYEITDSIFGKKNYYIINDYLDIKNDFVPLLLLEENEFYMDILEVGKITKFANEYEVIVKYKDIDLEYKYVFGLVDNRLVIKNILVN